MQNNLTVSTEVKNMRNWAIPLQGTPYADLLRPSQYTEARCRWDRNLISFWGSWALGGWASCCSCTKPTEILFPNMPELRKGYESTALAKLPKYVKRAVSLTCLSYTFVQHMHLSTHSIMGRGERKLPKCSSTEKAVNESWHPGTVTQQSTAWKWVTHPCVTLGMNYNRNV